MSSHSPVQFEAASISLRTWLRCTTPSIPSETATPRHSMSDQKVLSAKESPTQTAGRKAPFEASAEHCMRETGRLTLP